MTGGFQGFTPAAVEFLWGIRFQNERSWFESHKEVYLKELYRPMQALGRQVQLAMVEKFPKEPWNLKVTRIYRDARRLHGRAPYKDHLWFTLVRGDDSAPDAHPALWFELTPDGWSCGMGFWCAKASVMECHRQEILRDPKPLLKLTRALERQNRFVLEGPEYRRQKPCPQKELTAWFNKKSLSVGHDEPLCELLYTPELADRLVEDFTFLKPYYDYFASLSSKIQG